MVIAVEDIVDIESLEAWLNERPEELRRQCAVWISARSAARAIPKDWYGQHFDKRARERGLNGVWVSRCLLIAIAAMLRPQENFQDPKYVALAESYKNNAFFVDSSAPSAVGVAASSDVESQMAYLILAVTPQPELMDEVYAKHFFSAGSHGASSFERAHGIKEIFALPRVDCQLWLEFEGAGGIDIARLQFAPLWPDENPLAPEWEDLKAKLIADATSDDPYSADWSFWIDWYEGLLEGRAQNIYMLLEIVTTDKIDWEAPPREVNEAIALIVERHDLRERVTDLEKSLEYHMSTVATLKQRSDNNPPELVDLEAEARNLEVRKLYKAAQDVKEELSLQDPDPNRLRKFGNALMRAASACAKYVLGKIDKGLDEAVKVAGKAVGGLGVTYAGSQTETAKVIGSEVVTLAEKLIAAIGG